MTSPLQIPQHLSMSESWGSSREGAPGARSEGPWSSA